MPMKQPNKTENYKFDITTMAGLAYKRSWEEKRYLFKMLMLPFLVKLACFSVVVVYIDRDIVWLTGIVMLPAMFLEGWFLSHWARTVMTNGLHRWPFRPSGDEKKDLIQMLVRGRGVMVGTVSFVVINYLFYGYQAMMLDAMPLEFNPDEPDPRFTLFFCWVSAYHQYHCGSEWRYGVRRGEQCRASGFCFSSGHIQSGEKYNCDGGYGLCFFIFNG